MKSLDQASITFLEKVVNINSGTMNLEGVKAVGEEFDAAFKAIQFNTEWIEMPKEMNRAGHLFARIDGKRGKKLLLIGHLDTVFEADSPFQTLSAWRFCLCTRGNDMKGGDVAILFALGFARIKSFKRCWNYCCLTGDEERTGKTVIDL